MMKILNEAETEQVCGGLIMPIPYGVIVAAALVARNQQKKQETSKAAE